MNNDNTTPDEEVGVQVTDHLLIRDVDTNEVYVNQRGTAKNIDLGDGNED